MSVRALRPYDHLTVAVKFADGIAIPPGAQKRRSPAPPPPPPPPPPPNLPKESPPPLPRL